VVVRITACNTTFFTAFPYCCLYRLTTKNNYLYAKISFFLMHLQCCLYTLRSHLKNHLQNGLPIGLWGLERKRTCSKVVQNLKNHLQNSLPLGLLRPSTETYTRKSCMKIWRTKGECSPPLSDSRPKTEPYTPKSDVKIWRITCERSLALANLGPKTGPYTPKSGMSSDEWLGGRKLMSLIDCLSCPPLL